MINKTILVGRITKDPEVKYTGSNIPVVSFTIAVNRMFTDNSGERQADFISCVVWRKQAENLAKYVRKGALIGVEGRIQTRQYDQDGVTRYVTEVVCDSVQFLETRNDDQNAGQSNRSTYDDNDDPFYQSSKKLNVSEEDLPF